MTRKEAPGARTPGAADQRDTRRGNRTSRAVQATEVTEGRTDLARPGGGSPCPFCGARPEPPSRAARRLAARAGVVVPVLGVYRHEPRCTAAHRGGDAHAPLPPRGGAAR
ncbi:hypothetical protein GCM10009809_38310 [Isoptericola hypogeus]|uniref:Uncharacterized protein n=1 Tax=Isoptericola hypogeus TaxID=300179 RepID=A0ABN2JUE6_9MICO